MKSTTSLPCNSLMPKDSCVPNSFLVQVREDWSCKQRKNKLQLDCHLH